METAGALKGGQIVWGLANLGNGFVLPNGGGVMGKHTPGPWRIEPSINEDEPGFCIYAGEYGVCKIWDLNGNAENAANARLIAVAPDMLAALKELRSAAIGFREEAYRKCPELRVSNERVNMLSAFLLAADRAIANAGG